MAKTKKSCHDAEFTRTKTATKFKVALDLINKGSFNLLLIDVHLEGEFEKGLELVGEIYGLGYSGAVLVLTEDPSP